jgi:response regulator RpfG family c-di-GMP phosphodiesterase
MSLNLHPCVLFVDDEISTLNSISRFLRREPYKMLFAESGIDALTILDKEKVDILVTDLRMPEMSGLELLALVSDRFPRILLLVVSATTEKKEKDEVLATITVYDFISKPINPHDFKEVLRKACDTVTI